MRTVNNPITLFAAVLLLAFGAAAATTAHAFEITIGGHHVDGSGKPATESRPMHDFQAISSKGSIDVVVRQSDHEAVTLRGDDNLLPLVTTSVEPGRAGNTLVIGMKSGAYSYTSHNPIVVTVDVIALKAVSSSGSGDVRFETLKTPGLKLSLSGSADAHFASLKTDDLSIDIAGSGDVDGVGSAGHLKISIAGSGDVKLRGMAADDVSVDVAGSGDAVVTANKTLQVSVAGSGDVTWSGSAALTRSSVVGSGDITHR